MKYIAIIILSCLTFNQALSTDIYKSQDKDGNWVYSDKKPEGTYELISSGKKKAADPEPESEAEPQRRTMESVRTVVNTAQGDIANLYNSLYAQRDNPDGQVTVRFTIAKAGNVTRCEEEVKPAVEETIGKICETITALEYGTVVGPEFMQVSFTFSFSSQPG